MTFFLKIWFYYIILEICAFKLVLIKIVYC